MDTSQLPGRGIKPLLSLRKHYRVSLVIWLLVVLVGIPVAWIKGQSYYSAESVFQVAPNYMKTLATDKEVEFQSNSQYREFVNHLSNTVRRYDVIERALKKLRESGINVQPKGMTERKFIERLQKTILVRAVPDTYMVRIGMDSPDKATLADLINAVTTSFLETTKSEQIFGSAQRVETLEANAVQLLKEISTLENQRLEFADRLGLTTFGDNVVNPFDSTLFQARAKHTSAAMDRAQAEATLQAFLTLRETPTSLGRSLMEMRLQDNGLQALRNEVVKRSEELGRTTAGLEDKHPAKKPAQAEFDAINKRLQSSETAFEQAAFLNVKSRLVASVQQATQVETEVLLTLKKIEGQATSFAKDFQQAMRITSDIRKREQEHKDVRDRLNYLQSEKNAIGFVRLVTPALPAITPMGVGKAKLLLLVLVVASGLALVAPVALDMTNRRIYTVNEAEKLLGIPAAGWQLEVTDLPSQMYASEQTKRFASTLIRNKARLGQHVFAFTSIKASQTASTVIFDTAAALQQLGLRVLVVDADSFSPHPAFDDALPGLAEYLAGQAQAEAIVQTISHHATSLAGVGFGQQSAGGIQRLDLFKSLVQNWRESFDVVLIQLPPVLLSADAELLIEVLGQVFMVLEAQSVSKGEIMRAKRVLEKLDPEAVGLFVDRIPMFRGGGYMQELMLETLTKKNWNSFMSLSFLQLQVQVWRAQWGQRKMRAHPRVQEDSPTKSAL